MRRAVPALLGVVSVLALSAAPAGAATHKTFKFFSKQTSTTFLDVNGNPITDPNAAPVVGDTFISTDNDYKGNHKKHSKKLFATDHIACTLIAVDLTANTLTGNCDAQLALPGGMILIDRQKVNFTESRTVIPITGGTGRYAHASGTVTSISFSQNSNNSDLVVKVTF